MRRKHHLDNFTSHPLDLIMFIRLFTWMISLVGDILRILGTDGWCNSQWSENNFVSNLIKSNTKHTLQPVGPDWAINWTLGNFSKPLTTFNLPKSPTLLGNFCKSVKIFHFSREIVFGQFCRHLATFYWSHCLQRSLCACWVIIVRNGCL